MRGYPVTLNQCESDVVYSQCRFEVTFLQCLFLRWNVVTEETTFSNWCLDLATCPSPSRPGRDDVTRLVSAVRRPPRCAAPGSRTAPPPPPPPHRVHSLAGSRDAGRSGATPTHKPARGHSFAIFNFMNGPNKSTNILVFSMHFYGWYFPRDFFFLHLIMILAVSALEKTLRNGLMSG